MNSGNPHVKYSTLLITAIVVAVTFFFASTFDVARNPQDILAAMLPAAELTADNAAEPPKTGQNVETHTSGQPRAQIEETQHHFGVMAIAAERQHDFIVRNTGDAPLRLTKGKTSCKCTIADLTETEIPPGGSAPVRLSWKPIKRDNVFRQTAKILTNDEGAPEIEFVVQGRVEPRVVVEPGWMWSAGDMRGSKPVVIKGIIYSAAEEDFDIENFRAKPSASSTIISPLHRVEQLRLGEAPEPVKISALANVPQTKTSFEPLSADKLQSVGAKCGYELTVELSPERPPGLFREDLEIVTDLKGDELLTCAVVGHRVGSFEILPPQGVRWFESQHRLEIDRFAAADGKTVSLAFIVLADKAAPLKLLAMRCNPAALKCSLEPVETKRGSHGNRYNLKLEIPAGLPPMTHNREHPAILQLKTSHPELPQLDLSLLFTSH